MQITDRRFSVFMLADKDATKTKWKNHFQNRSPATKSEKASKLEVKALADGTAEILVYDEIGYWGITAKDFAVALAGITAPTINVRINSPGGDVFDGLAIYNSLKAHPATINTFVDGWAASAASFIMLAGDTVSAAKSSMVMIHNAWGLGIGNAADMRSLADVLDKIDGQIADIYSAKSGKDRAVCLAAMGAETWLTGDEAKAFGLVDSVVGDDPGKDQETADDQATARSTAQRIAARAVPSAAYDPDGDGDDDAAEAVTLITRALGMLTDAIEALTGTEDDDADENQTQAAELSDRIANMRRRLALAAHE